MKKIAKTRHNPISITDFECKIPKYKNRYHHLFGQWESSNESNVSLYLPACLHGSGLVPLD